MIRHSLLFLLGLGAAACNDGISQFVLQALIVDENEGNPVAGTDATTLRVDIAEGDLPVRTLEFPITDGDFDAELEFASFTSITRIRVGMSGPTTDLVTAPPAFVPSVSGSFLKVVAAAPFSCVSVSFDAMQARRSRFGMLQSGTFALLIGGTTATEEQVEFLDALQWRSSLFSDELSLSPLGDTKTATIGDGKILVLPSDAGPFIFDMLDASRRVTQVVLHLGAGPQSALVAVPGRGAMAIGGEASGVPRAGVSLVQPDGSVIAFELAQPRSGPAATPLGQDVLVVGGDDAGSAELILAGSTSGALLDGLSDGIRSEGLLVGDGEEHALLLGGTDAVGSVRNDTLQIDGCPSACVATEGPQWDTARLGAIVPEGSAMLVGGQSSQWVEQVDFDDGESRIESLVELSVPRAFAGAIVYESGAFVVSGGEDSATVRDDFEFCVPAQLRPL